MVGHGNENLDRSIRYGGSPADGRRQHGDPAGARRVLGSSELACPPVGDWLFPSNHATLAAALAVELSLARPRLAALALSLAGVAATARGLAGVHYPHDVLAGLVLGAAVVTSVVVGLRPLADRLVEQAGRTPVVGSLVDARKSADSEH